MKRNLHIVHLLMMHPNVTSQAKADSINGLLPKVTTDEEMKVVYPAFVIAAMQYEPFVHDIAQCVRDSLKIIESKKHNDS